MKEVYEQSANALVANANTNNISQKGHEKRTCYDCHKQCHFIRDFRKLKTEQNEEVKHVGNIGDDSGTVAQAKEIQNTDKYYHVSINITTAPVEGTSPNIWVVDYSASGHMTPNKNHLDN